MESLPVSVAEWAGVAALAAGLGAGTAHALLGPDHLAAVAPLSLRRGRGAGWLGLRWGLGHAAGALVLGIGAVTLRDALPWDGLSVWAERAVGVLLVVLGVWTIRRAAATIVHDHAHTHVGGQTPAAVGPHATDGAPASLRPHTHLHVHRLGTRHDPAAAAVTRHRHEHAALGIGFLHGLAGFGHLWAALPALALPRAEAILYLAAYGLGTLAAMSLFSSVLGRFGARASASGTCILQGAMRAAGGVAVAVGVWWIWGGGL